jgi:hypothetical protein
MAFKPKIATGARPYFEAKLEAGAISSVAQMTGTPVRTTINTGSATATTLAEYVMALTQDLQARGIIK